MPAATEDDQRTLCGFARQSASDRSLAATRFSLSKTYDWRTL